MKTILCSCLLLAASARAEEAADRDAIARTVAMLNQEPRPAGLFVEGADASLLDKLAGGKLRRFQPALTPGTDMTVVISHEPWGEARIGPQPVVEWLNPRISSRAVQFITPEVAIADGVFTFAGADGAVQSTPLLFVMKKDGQAWKIAVVRAAGR